MVSRLHRDRELRLYTSLFFPRSLSEVRSIKERSKSIGNAHVCCHVILLLKPAFNRQYYSNLFYNSKYTLDLTFFFLLFDKNVIPSLSINLFGVFEIFTDNAANRMIRNLEVNSPSDGCSWTGTLSSFLEVFIDLFR